MNDLETLHTVTPELADIVFANFAGGEALDWPRSVVWGQLLVTD